MANQKQIARAAAAEARKAAQAKIDKRNKIIGIIAILLVAGAALLFALGGGKDTSQPAGPISMNPTHNVQIDVQDYGTITAELYGEAAPITVANFVKLVNEGFYDGLTFHRIISGFMIQGGDPLGNGTGGADQDIKGEFAANGWNNPIAHERGVLSMARSSAPNSASSQFFIMHQAAPHLDGSYAAFGKVLTGMDVAEDIVNTKRDYSDRPYEDQRIASIRVEAYGEVYPFERL
jgi:peptidyl-prolyl cis-trans isomerase B (cyclophilin B)